MTQRNNFTKKPNSGIKSTHEGNERRQQLNSNIKKEQMNLANCGRPSRGQSEGGYYHGNLRVDPSIRQKTYDERLCEVCGKLMSKFKRGTKCYGCDK